MKITAAVLLTSAALATSAQAADPVVLDFESGSTGGWTFHVTTPDVLETTGGSPDGWLHNEWVASFAPTPYVRDAASPFTGDWKAMGVTGFSFDATLISKSFGDPVGYPMSVVLRDTKGTPDVEDDDYVFYVGDQVPLTGQGWKHFEFDVPTASDELPTGWFGGWYGDSENLRPGVTWNDVITNVDSVEIWWIDPRWFAIIADWDLGLDNITLEFGDSTPVCTADLNGDETVDTTDLLAVLGTWGTCPKTCNADLDGNGMVDTNDLLELLGAWGPCPAP